MTCAFTQSSKRYYKAAASNTGVACNFTHLGEKPTGGQPSKAAENTGMTCLFTRSSKMVVQRDGRSGPATLRNRVRLPGAIKTAENTGVTCLFNTNYEMATRFSHVAKSLPQGDKPNGDPNKPEVAAYPPSTTPALYTGQITAV